MRSRLPYALLVFFILAAFSIGLLLLGGKGCYQTYRSDKIIWINGRKFSAQTATTTSERAEGLSGKSCIGRSQAMLFTFDKPGNYGFWMKGMKFNIDILWVNSKHQVVDEENNISPASYPKSFINQNPASDVVELKTGSINQLGIGTGTQLYY